MASLKERNGNYSIRFVQTIDGKRKSTQFSLYTSRKKVAEKHKRRLELEHEEGNINVFEGFNFISWRDGLDQPKTENNRYLLSQSISEFLQDRTDLGAKSRVNYEQLLNAFNRHVGQTMLTELVEKKDVQDYCFRDNISIHTQNNYLTHFSVFFKWVKTQGHGTDITKDIKAKTEPENLKDQILSSEDLAAVLKAHKQHIANKQKKGVIMSDSHRQLWFEPLIRFAYKSGLRKSEIIKLKWKHVDIENYLITVVAGKRGKSRTVVIDNELKELLNKWKKLIRYGKESYVFESPTSTSSQSLRMGLDTPRKNFKIFAQEAGLSDSIRFHSLRHTAATNYLKAGYNLHEVQKQMGHSSVAVTERYLHLVPNDLKDKAKKLGLI